MKILWGRRPSTAGLTLAVCLLVAALVEVWVTGTARGPRGLGTVVALLSTVFVACRRKAPLVALAGMLAALLLPLVSRPVVEVDSLSVAVAWIVAVHAVNAYSPVRVGWLATLAAVAAVALVTAVTPASSGARLGNVIWGVVLFGTAAMAGQVMRRLADGLAVERAAGEEAARLEERRRLAREVHDVVSHGVAVMVVQSEAAQ